MPTKPKTKPLESKSDRVVCPRIRKGQLQPVVEVVLKVEGKGRFEDSMLKGSIALGLSRDCQPPDRGHVGVVDGIHVAMEGLKVHANLPNPNIHHIDSMMLL
jgi:hypothetical protein